MFEGSERGPHEEPGSEEPARKHTPDAGEPAVGGKSSDESPGGPTGGEGDESPGGAKEKVTQPIGEEGRVGETAHPAPEDDVGLSEDADTGGEEESGS